MKKNKYRMVEIPWIDSKGFGPEWEYIDEIKDFECAECVSVGYLLKDKKDFKCLVQSYGCGQIMGRLSIPSCAITKMSFLAPSQQTSK